MTATISKFFEKCKTGSARYARASVQEKKASFDSMPQIARAHLDGTMEGFDLAISVLVKHRTELQHGEVNEKQLSLFKEG